MKALFNGESTGEWTQARGLHYGDGVFRTLLGWREKPLDWEAQFEKFAADCKALGLEPPLAADLSRELQELLRGQDRAVIKIMVWRKSTGRGYAPAGSASDRLCLVYPAPLYPSTFWEEGIRAFQCDIRLSAQPALAGIKHLNRLEHVLASRTWPDGMDEGILCDQNGHVVCGTRSNLFWVSHGHVMTPDLHDCGVAGVMRNKINKLCPSLDIPICIGKGSWEALLNSDEAFISNSLIGIWPLRSLALRQWQRGSVTAALQAAIAHPRLD